MHGRGSTPTDPDRNDSKMHLGLPTPWPAEAELILSALETGRHQVHAAESRQLRRLPYRVLAKLRLFSDPSNSAAWTLYTRDVNQRSLGFVTQARLPLGHGGRIEMLSPDGARSQFECTLLRCRQAAPGWYEGALYFNREQSTFRVGVSEQGDITLAM